MLVNGHWLCNLLLLLLLLQCLLVDRPWAHRALYWQELRPCLLSFVFVFSFLHSIFTATEHWFLIFGKASMVARSDLCDSPAPGLLAALSGIWLSGPSWWLVTVSLASMRISAPHWFVKSISFASHRRYSHSSAAYTSVAPGHSF